MTVPASEAELASDALWALGVAAIEERGGTSGTEDDLVELWTSLGDDAPAVARAAEGFPARWRWKVIELDPSVTDTWRAHAHASWVERDLVVVPAWLPFEDPPGTTVVRIEPGATFGLGDHPTTVLCLRALRAALPPGGSVLDVGSGSGVLAVTAARARRRAGRRHRHLAGVAARRGRQRGGQRGGGAGRGHDHPSGRRSRGLRRRAGQPAGADARWPWPMTWCGWWLPAARS